MIIHVTCAENAVKHFLFANCGIRYGWMLDQGSNDEDSLISSSLVNLGFDLEQIATEMIFAGSNSLNSAS